MLTFLQYGQSFPQVWNLDPHQGAEVKRTINTDKHYRAASEMRNHTKCYLAGKEMASVRVVEHEKSPVVLDRLEMKPGSLPPNFVHLGGLLYLWDSVSFSVTLGSPSTC